MYEDEVWMRGECGQKDLSDPELVTLNGNFLFFNINEPVSSGWDVKTT